MWSKLNARLQIRLCGAPIDHLKARLMDKLYGATIYLVRQTEVLPPNEVLPPSGGKLPQEAENSQP